MQPHVDNDIISHGAAIRALSDYSFLSRLLVHTYSFWSWLLPNRYQPYIIDGGTIYLNIKESKMMLMRALGLYEINKYSAIRALIKPGSVFIDIGANKGDFSLFAAMMLGDSGKVITIEPEPENMRWIERSVLKNGYNNIYLHQLAISEYDGYSKLFLGSKSGWHTLLKDQAHRDKGEIEVKVCRLDDLIHSDLLSRPCMIKIDVEGAELSVLRGASNILLSASDIVLLIDIHSDMGVDLLQICSHLQAFNFEIFEESPPFNIALKEYRRATSIVARKLNMYE